MSSTYSPILRSELIGAGDQAGTWGSTTNSNFQYIFETAIAGYVAVTVSPTSNNQVLTYVNGPSASPALNQSVYAMLKLNAGTLSANFSIFTPPVSKTYTIWNNTSYTATFYNSTIIGNTIAAGSGIVVPAGAKVWIWSDGTSFYGNDTIAGNLNVAGSLTLSTPLAVAYGGTGITSFGSGIATFLGTPTSANLASAITDETGSGLLVFSVSPTFTGIPLAPTATPGTNTTQIATTAFALANGIPSGAIVMWSGSIASIPSGWLLCNGSSGTPDLRDRFVIGAGSSYAVAATGGSADAIVVSHTHTATSVVTDPGHYHLQPNSGGAGGTITAPGGQANTGNGAYTGYSGTAVATTGVTVATTNQSAGASGVNANLPPYYALAYIMKT